jgi:hypothetical protein
VIASSATQAVINKSFVPIGDIPGDVRPKRNVQIKIEPISVGLRERILLSGLRLRARRRGALQSRGPRRPGSLDELISRLRRLSARVRF